MDFIHVDSKGLGHFRLLMGSFELLVVCICCFAKWNDENELD